MHHARNRWIAIAGIAAWACGSNALAAEYGTVVSRAPAYAQVAVAQQQCVAQPQIVRSAPSGAGSLLGALIGGVAGNAIGHGGGRALATGAGVIGGALLGDRVEADGMPSSAVTIPSCHTVNQYQTQRVGYDVVYAYHGQNYSTRLASDPGEPGAALPLNVSISPVATAPVVQPAPMTVYAAPQVVYAPSPMVYSPPVYVTPTVGLSLDAGWGGRYHHWR